jgi:hypothetical protein
MSLAIKVILYILSKNSIAEILGLEWQAMVVTVTRSCAIAFVQLMPANTVTALV